MNKARPVKPLMKNGWITDISIVVSIGSFIGMAIIFVIQMNMSEKNGVLLTMIATFGKQI